MPKRAFVRAVVVPLVLASGFHTVLVEAGIKISTQRDKTANFSGIKTWGWLGEPKIVRASASPDFQDARFDRSALVPPVQTAIERELAAKGLKRVPDGQPADALVTFYLVATIGVNAQTFGSYYQYTTGWGTMIGDQGSTQSMSVEEQGSLIIDVTDRTGKVAIWRGTAKSRINRENSQDKRLALLDEAVTGVIRKFPAK